MFDEFSTKYESTFKTIFILWVVLWSIINFFTILRNYASYANTSSFIGTEYVGLGHWWFATFGTIIGFSIGIFLLFWTASISSRIEKNRRYRNSYECNSCILSIYHNSGFDGISCF